MARAYSAINAAKANFDGIYSRQDPRGYFVSRPWEEARAAPLADIVTVASGRHCPVGARYVGIGDGAGTLITVEP